MSIIADIAREDPDQADVLEMLDQCDAYYAGLYPAESNRLLDIATLQRANVAFYVARLEGKLLGFGSVVMHDAFAELKRMYIAPESRGHGVGRRLLRVLEAHALGVAHTTVRLETGIKQPAAIELYRAAGYVEIGAFGEYAHDDFSEFDEYSVFMEKRLT